MHADPLQSVARIIDQERIRARLSGQPDWGIYGSANEHRRFAVPVSPESRRRCSCGCKTRATLLGMANGIALTVGCEFSVKRWVRNR